MDKYQHLLRQGSVLIDNSGKLDEPALLYYLEHEITDERKRSDGSNEVVSKQMNFVYLTKSGKIINAGYAPYLDCEVPKLGDYEENILKENWIKNSPEKIVINYALNEIIPDEFRKIEITRKETVDKITRAVQERLTREIGYWDRRANELKQKELVGKERVGLNSGRARQTADELDTRRKNRLEDLEKQKKLINKQPFVVGGALVIPAHMIAKKDAPDFSIDPNARKKSENIAIAEVIRVEKSLGRDAKDVSKRNYGWDIESLDTKTKNIFFIEVKGREKDAKIVTVTRNEILAGLNVSEDLNNSDRYILAIVQLEDEKVINARYIRKPFDKDIQFETASVNFDIKKLLAKSEEPR